MEAGMVEGLIPAMESRVIPLSDKARNERSNSENTEHSQGFKLTREMAPLMEEVKRK